MGCVVATVQVVKDAQTHRHATLTLKPWRTTDPARWRMSAVFVEAPVPFLSAGVSTFCLERAIAKET